MMLIKIPVPKMAIIDFPTFALVDPQEPLLSPEDLELNLQISFVVIGLSAV